MRLRASKTPAAAASLPRRIARFVREEFDLLFERAGTRRRAVEQAPETLPARFSTWVAIGIAVISIIGAVVAWRAATAAQSAAELDREAMQYLIQERAAASEIDVNIDHDRRLEASFATHAEAWKLLERRAAELASKGDARAAREVDQRAQDERQLALSLNPYFIEESLTLDSPVYDVAFAHTIAYAADDFLRSPRSKATLDEASTAHDRTVALVLIEALVLTSLFFLTLGRFTRRSYSYVLAGIGSIVVVIGVVVWLVVEVGA